MIPLISALLVAALLLVLFGLAIKAAVALIVLALALFIAEMATVRRDNWRR